MNINIINQISSVISKGLHIILFVGLFFLIRDQNGNTSWLYTILGLLVLLFSMKIIDDMHGEDHGYNPMGKLRTFLTAIVPSSFIYLGLYLVIQNVINNRDIAFALFVLTFIGAGLGALIEEAKAKAKREYTSSHVRKSTTIFFAVVIIIIAASILADMQSRDKFILMMVINSYIIPSVFIVFPILGLVKIAYAAEMLKENAKQASRYRY